MSSGTHNAVFLPSTCPACGRPAEAPGECPWCGQRLPPEPSLLFRLAALAGSGLLLFLPPPDDPAIHALLLPLSAVLCALLVAAAAPDTRALLHASLAAATGAALCLAFPETAVRVSHIVRGLAVWMVPLTGIAWLADRGAHLPPVPAATRPGRLWQAVREPAFVLAICVVCVCAAARPATAKTALTLAFAAYAWLRGPHRHPATFSVCLLLVLLLGFAPFADARHHPGPFTVLVAGLAVCGIIQSLGDGKLNQTGTEPIV